MTWAITKSTPEEVELIDNKLGDYNRTQVQYTAKMNFLPLNFHIKDKQGHIIAGVNAMTCWQMLHISELYVDENYRGKGMGTLLLNKVESEAKAIGAITSHTDTFDWQAEGFYLKLGYEVFGVINDCPRGHKRFFLKKRLSEN